MTEKLYNGIVLEEPWPPQNMDPTSDRPMSVPYLENPPDCILIDTGRQLFVDDFLIEETGMQRVFHRAVKHDENPMFEPETTIEARRVDDRRVFPAAVPKSGGVWWDSVDGRFKMWYEAGWCGTLAYAESDDGLTWRRPRLDVDPPTNRIVPELVGDSGAVFIDHDADEPGQRYKMFHRETNAAIQTRQGNGPANCLVSADGVHWSDPIKTTPVGDRSTMFYNPFRQRWIYSIRSAVRGRTRHYREHPDFLKGATWTDDECVYWTGADRLDEPDAEIGATPQLYNLDAVAYESVMLGMFEIHLGPENDICRAGGFPKITELKTAFSRDGFHWHRPDRRAFIPAARRPSAWDRGYVQSVGGVCLVMEDELWFYYTGFRGEQEHRTDAFDMDSTMYGNGATGMAKLRRDGFASMQAGDAEEALLTRPLVFNGSHLFVNVDNPRGRLLAEVCSPDGRPLEGFTREDCRPLSGNTTRGCVRWDDDRDLGRLAGKPVRIRFFLRQGDLYAFWVSQSTNGMSDGYVGAGGPSYSDGTDSGS